MNVKFYIAAALLLGCTSGFAQPKDAGAPQLLIKSNFSLMSPVWSPDGKHIAVTGDNYSGIWVANADGTGLSKILSDAGSGYKMIWNGDSKTIIARTDQLINNRRYHEIKSIDIATAATETLVSSTRNISGTSTLKNIKADKAIATSAYEIMVNDPVHATSLISSLSQYRGKMIINPALSPNGLRTAFQIPGHGVFVCNADGSSLMNIGKGSYPSWLPDNKSVVVARIQDNGNVFTAADLYCVDCTNGNVVKLTHDSRYIPITHAVSPDGSKVAFENSADGCIYVINLKY